jgi:6-phosphogluconolactonase
MLSKQDAERPKSRLNWLKELCDRLNCALAESFAENQTCSLMLTGGRSASSLYRFWSASFIVFTEIPNIKIYFGDERCVPPDHPESNHRMAIDTLFRRGIPATAQVHRMHADAEDLDAAADCYAELLPDAIDVLLLSAGDDGHIASLFPKSPALHENQRLVVPVVDPKTLCQRLTITPPVIRCARKVFVLAQGGVKRAIYEAALQDPEDLDNIPARLVLDRNWIFEAD